MIIPGEYTQYWFDGNIEQWTQELTPFKGKPDLHFLEIGTYEGRATRWLLDNILTNETSTVDVVDTFEGGEDQGAFQGAIADGKLLNRFKTNVALFQSRVIIHQSKSQTALKKLQKRKEYFDFIYIDASHVAEDTYNDAKLAWPLLKKGGLLFFDDYTWSWNYVKEHNRNPEIDNPKVGIDKFLTEVQGEYDTTYVLHQYHIRKR